MLRVYDFEVVWLSETRTVKAKIEVQSLKLLKMESGTVCDHLCLCEFNLRNKHNHVRALAFVVTIWNPVFFEQMCLMMPCLLHGKKQLCP